MIKFGNFAVNVNDKCNLTCDYCFIKEKGGNEISYLVLNQFRKLVQEYGRKPIKVDIFGTEPLISWDKVMHLINMGSSFNWKMGITTNATLITQKRAEILKEKGVGVLVSYDGSRKSHNANRKFRSSREGTWQRVVNSLKIMQDAGVRYGCAMVVTPDNLKYLMHNVKSAETRGFEFIALNPQFTVGHRKNPKSYDWELLRKKYREVAEWALKHNTRLLFTFDAIDAYVAGPRKIRNAACGAAKGSIAMDWDGGLYICHRACGRGEFTIGHVDTGISQEIITSYRMRDINECHTCPVASQRGSCGHCWIVAQDITGDKMKLPDEMCLWQSIIHDIEYDLFHRTNSGATRMSSNKVGNTTILE